MPTDLGPVFYPDLRPRRPLYLSGVDHEVLRRLEGNGPFGGLVVGGFELVEHGRFQVGQFLLVVAYRSAG
jgi:hypothetical protein